MNVYGAFKCNFSQTHRYTPQKERGSARVCASECVVGIAKCGHSDGEMLGLVAENGGAGQNKTGPAQLLTKPIYEIHTKYLRDHFCAG